MFNHSCVENVTHAFDSDGVVRFRAVEAVGAGQELNISYCGDEHLRTSDT